MSIEESIRTTIGIKILLRDIVEQIDNINFEQIKEILNSGFIEDENRNFNKKYREIIWSNELHEYIDNAEKYKKIINDLLKESGTYDKISETLAYGSLLEKHLLVPIKDILDMCKTNSYSNCDNDINNYNVEEKFNTKSRDIDFNILTIQNDINKKYKYITKYKIVVAMIHYTS